MTRFCSGCNADVEVSQGICLLGHPVEHAAPTGSLVELRAEVDKAFSDASATVSSALTASDVARSAGLEIEDRAVSAVPAPPPPPPPSGTAGGRVHAGLYSGIETATAASDPIEAFAPAPRMDWGPTKGLLRRRRAEAY